jgi:predicted  nucleic acid-binding Zn-ribbon protein
VLPSHLEEAAADSVLGTNAILPLLLRLQTGMLQNPLPRRPVSRGRRDVAVNEAPESRSTSRAEVSGGRGDEAPYHGHSTKAFSFLQAARQRNAASRQDTPVPSARLPPLANNLSKDASDRWSHTSPSRSPAPKNDPSLVESEEDSADGDSEPTSDASEDDDRFGYYKNYMFPTLPSTTNPALRSTSRPSFKVESKQAPKRTRTPGKSDVQEVTPNVITEHEHTTLVAAPSQAGLQNLFRSLESKRKEVQALRRQCADKRAEVRDLRRTKDEADNMLMSFLRPRLAVPTRTSHYSEGNFILKCIEEMQQARDRYTYVEAEYEMLESDLDREERELAIIETEFFTFLFKEAVDPDYGSASDEAQSDDDAASQTSRASLLGITAQRERLIHPLYDRLLDAVADRGLAREHHADLLFNRQRILYELETTWARNKMGRDEQGRFTGGSTNLSERDIGDIRSKLEGMTAAELVAEFSSDLAELDLEFLQDFDEAEKAAQESLSELNRKVNDLRTSCVNAGISREGASYEEEFVAWQDDGEGVRQADAAGSLFTAVDRVDSLAHPRFPILLSNPSHVLQTVPLTAKMALRAVTKLDKTDPAWKGRLADAVKEVAIETILEGSKENDKLDYINRWMLQKLRTSRLEVLLLYTIFSADVKILKLRRWQEDVLHYWPQDGANRMTETFDRPPTTNSHFLLDIDGSETARTDSDFSRDEAYQLATRVELPLPEPMTDLLEMAPLQSAD